MKVLTKYTDETDDQKSNQDCNFKKQDQLQIKPTNTRMANWTRELLIDLDNVLEDHFKLNDEVHPE